MIGYNLRAYAPDLKKRFENETSVELHISIETEDIINKDMASNYSYPSVTGYSFDMTVEQQVADFRTGGSALRASDVHKDQPIKLALERFASAGPINPDQHELCYGTFFVQSVSYKADNRKIVTSTVKFLGTGELGQGNYPSASALSEE